MSTIGVHMQVTLKWCKITCISQAKPCLVTIKEMVIYNLIFFFSCFNFMNVPMQIPLQTAMCMIYWAPLPQNLSQSSTLHSSPTRTVYPPPPHLQMTMNWCTVQSFQWHPHGRTSLDLAAPSVPSILQFLMMLMNLKSTTPPKTQVMTLYLLMRTMSNQWCMML